MTGTSRSTALLFVRALRLRCPNCGSPGIFRTWFQLVTECPVCHLQFNRGEQGYEVGSYWFNITADELLFVAILGLVIWRTWPAPPWTLLEYGGPILMILLPVAFFPFSKTLYVAFDLMFRPDRPGREL